MNLASLLAIIPVAILVIGILYCLVSLDDHGFDFENPAVLLVFANTGFILATSCFSWSILVGTGLLQADWRWTPISLFGGIVIVVSSLLARRIHHETTLDETEGE